MPLTVNLRHLESRNLLLKGELPAAEMDVDERDEAVLLKQPVQHEIEVEKFDTNLLLTGSLQVTLDCECVRCLKPFKYRLKLDPWTCHIPLEGEESAPVTNDCVDLTPYVREDILLAFPQHPLCDPQCEGLKKVQVAGKKPKSDGAGVKENVSSAWADLDKLKLKN